MEALDGAILRPRPLRENDDGIAPGHQFFHVYTVSGQAPGCGKIASLADDGPIEREFPHPVVGHEDEFGLQGNEGQDIQVALMVANVHGRPGKVLSVRIVQDKGASRDHPDGPESDTPDDAVKEYAAGKEEGYQRKKRHRQHHGNADKGRPEHVPQGKRRFARCSPFGGEPAEDQRRQVVGHSHHGEHANHRHQPQGTHGRVFGQNQCANANKHDKGAERDGVLVGVQDFFARSALIQKAFRDKNAVVVPHPEDEGGKDDIDDIKLQAAEAHDALNPVPAHRQRQEGHKADSQAAETGPQEEEDNERAKEAHSPEIL